MRDLMVALDDADGRILDARFVEQESTASTFESLYAVLTRYGRFAELYTDRGSHSCRTPKANGPALTDGCCLPRCLTARLSRSTAVRPRRAPTLYPRGRRASWSRSVAGQRGRREGRGARGGWIS